MTFSNSPLWKELEQAYQGVHQYGGHALRLKPSAVLMPQLTDTWACEDTNSGLSAPFRSKPLEASDVLCRMLEEFSQTQPCRIEVDGMDVLDWQAWLDAGLGQFDRSVFVRIFPTKRERQSDQVSFGLMRQQQISPG